MRLYRAATKNKWGSDGGTNMSDLDIIRDFQFVAPLNLVMLARIQLFLRVALKAPDYVLHILYAADEGVIQTGWQQFGATSTRSLHPRTLCSLLLGN